jgi:hypothetical protein
MLHCVALCYIMLHIVNCNWQRLVHFTCRQRCTDWRPCRTVFLYMCLCLAYKLKGLGSSWGQLHVHVRQRVHVRSRAAFHEGNDLISLSLACMWYCSLSVVLRIRRIRMHARNMPICLHACTHNGTQCRSRALIGNATYLLHNVTILLHKLLPFCNIMSLHRTLDVAHLLHKCYMKCYTMCYIIFGCASKARICRPNICYIVCYIWCSNM